MEINFRYIKNVNIKEKCQSEIAKVIADNVSNNIIFCAMPKNHSETTYFPVTKKAACDSPHRPSNFPDQFPGNQLSALVLLARMHMRPTR